MLQRPCALCSMLKFTLRKLVSELYSATYLITHSHCYILLPIKMLQGKETQSRQARLLRFADHKSFTFHRKTWNAEFSLEINLSYFNTAVLPRNGTEE